MLYAICVGEDDAAVKRKQRAAQAPNAPQVRMVVELVVGANGRGKGNQLAMGQY